jgi:circadian clock protein KaiC
MERVTSGIPGFDSMMGGGISRPSLILIAGQQGTGKSTLGLQFLLNGTKAGEKGLYVSFLGCQQILFRNLSESYGFDFDNPATLGLISFKEYDFSSMTSIFEQSLNYILHEVQSPAPVKRIVIDPLNLMIDEFTINAANTEFQRVTRMGTVYRDLVKSANCIVIGIIEDRILGNVIQKQLINSIGYGELLADGLVVFESYLDGSEIKKKAAVTRLRGTRHSTRYHSLVLKPNEGISFLEMAT